MTDFVYPPGAAALPASAVAIAGSFVLTWPSAVSAVVANGSYQLALVWPWAGGAITGLSAKTANGSFVAGLSVSGMPVAGLGAVTVDSATATTTAAGSNALTYASSVTLAISAASGSPTDAVVQVNYTHTQV